MTKKQFIMTKEQFIDFMLHVAKRGVEKVFVYRFPDGCGGYQHYVSMYEVFKDFTYKEFEGDLSDVVRHRSMTFVDHYEPLHEWPYDVSVTLEELVFEFFALS